MGLESNGHGLFFFFVNFVCNNTDNFIFLTKYFYRDLKNISFSGKNVFIEFFPAKSAFPI